MISLNDIEKSYGARTLFEGVTLKLVPGSRYGLVGANGSGKSTLMRIIAGDDQPSSGSVTIPSGTRLGVLRQDHFLSDEEEILALAMAGGYGRNLDDTIAVQLGTLREALASWQEWNNGAV